MRLSKSQSKRVFSFLLMLIFIASCTAESSSTLPLEEYIDPASRFSFAIPQGWQTSELPEENVLVFTPADYSGDITELRVLLFAAETDTFDTQEHLDQANALLQPFLTKYLDETYQVINQGETEVAKSPAVLLDFAKPYADLYLEGRLVMVAMPGFVLAFLGMGESEAWEDFLPTFRAMLKEFQLLPQSEVTPTP
jgi:hypothetical protein